MKQKTYTEEELVFLGTMVHETIAEYITNRKDYITIEELSLIPQIHHLYYNVKYNFEAIAPRMD